MINDSDLAELHYGTFMLDDDVPLAVVTIACNLRNSYMHSHSRMEQSFEHGK